MAKKPPFEKKEPRGEEKRESKMKPGARFAKEKKEGHSKGARGKC